MIPFSEYNEKGEIVRVTFVDEDSYNKAFMYLPTHVVGDYDRDLYYVKNGVALEKALQNTELIGNALHNLPVPCVISIDDISYDCFESFCELEFNSIGTFKIIVKAVSHKDKEFIYENFSQ